MSTSTQGNKVNVQAFIRQARLLTENKVFFNKDLLKSYDVMERCMAVARQYLGNDINFLHGDAQSVRLYINDVFGDTLTQLYGRNKLRLLEDGTNSGYSQLDIEHGLLLYYKLLSINSPLANYALGILYYLAAFQLVDKEEGELTQISKVAPRSLITPAFELDSKFFRWKRCNFVLRKYMLSLSKPEGYNAFYFEKTGLPQISYLMNQGTTFDEAENMVKNATGGLFYSFIPVDLESQLMPGILTGAFDTSVMDGYYTQTYIRDTAKLSQEITVDDVYNVYNMMVKPNMVELMGMVINNVNTEASKNQYLSPSDMSIYHVSPHRIGILLKDRVSLQDALPNLGQYFKPVNDFDIATLAQGDFL
jgi:hypothetical protein